MQTKKCDCTQHLHEALKPEGKCIYCGLKLRGKGCAYSPNRVHVVIEPGKCIYCGLKLRGKGCAYSPSGTHIMSSEFGHLQAEQTMNSLIMAHIIEQINAPFTESTAYDLGIIDENGVQLKDPKTYMEKKAFSPTIQYLFKLKRIFGGKLDVLNTEMYLENARAYSKAEDMVNENWNAETYIKQQELEETFRNEVDSIFGTLYNAIRETNKKGLSLEKTEKIILQVITENVGDSHP
jgi:hypothetical protein